MREIERRIGMQMEGNHREGKRKRRTKIGEQRKRHKRDKGRSRECIAF